MKVNWQTPVFLPPTAKKVERKYFVPSMDHEYLYTHPSPGSLVVTAANKHEWQRQQGPMPRAKDTKKLDLFGRKVYSTGGLQLLVANQQAMLSRVELQL